MLDGVPVIIKEKQFKKQKEFMDIKKAIGRPTKINMRTVIKLADSIQHNATVTEACEFTGISRETYYYYLNNNSVFRKKMNTARDNQNKVIMSFLTTY